MSPLSPSGRSVDPFAPLPARRSWVARQRLMLAALAVALVGIPLLFFMAPAGSIRFPDPEPEGRYVDVSFVLPGDCIWRKLADHPVWGYVKVVDCKSADWQYEMTGRFIVSGAQEFPGDEVMLKQAQERCEPEATNYLVPDEGLWADNERWILCFAPRARPGSAT